MGKAFSIALIGLTMVDGRRKIDSDSMDVFNKRTPVISHDESVNNAIGTVMSPLVEASDFNKMCLFKD